MVYQRFNYKDSKTFMHMMLRHIKYLEGIMEVRTVGTR